MKIDSEKSVLSFDVYGEFHAAQHIKKTFRFLVQK